MRWLSAKRPRSPQATPPPDGTIGSTTTCHLPPRFGQIGKDCLRHRRIVQLCPYHSLSALSWLGVHSDLVCRIQKKKELITKLTTIDPVLQPGRNRWNGLAGAQTVVPSSTSSFIFSGQNTTDTRQMRPVKLCHHCSPLPAPYESSAVKLSTARWGSSSKIIRIFGLPKKMNNQNSRNHFSKPFGPLGNRGTCSW